MKICTCIGVCKGAAGLGEGWHCAIDAYHERCANANMTKPHHVIVDWDYDNFIFQDGFRVVSFDVDPVENEILVSGWPMVGVKLDRVLYRRVGDGKYELAQHNYCDRARHEWCANRDCPLCLREWNAAQ
mgnify:CR=1 FL=1